MLLKMNGNYLNHLIMLLNQVKFEVSIKRNLNV